MARIRLAGVLLVAAVSLGAVTAGSASAEIPELGRCVKVEGVQEGKKTVYHGKYANKNCIKQKVISNGKYEFLPGPGPKSEYYGVALDPSPELVTVSGRKISCSVIAFKGNYTGPKTETVKISLGGCEEGSRPCQTNPASVGEIEGLSALEGELGTISKGTNKLNVGWDLKHEGVIFTFTCGKFPEIGGLEALEGPSVIGVVAGGFFSNLDKMSIYSTIKYNETGGKQIPEAFEGGLKDTLLLKSITGNTSEQVALKGVEETTSGKGEPIEKEENQEQLEVKAKGN